MDNDFEGPDWEKKGRLVSQNKLPGLGAEINEEELKNILFNRKYCGGLFIKMEALVIGK